jgi:hypothetical protein
MSMYISYSAPLTKTFTIKAPTIFQTSSDSGGTLPISPPIIRGHLGNELTDLISHPKILREQKAPVVGYSRLEKLAVAGANIAANIVNIYLE